MIQIDDKLISFDVIEKPFFCNITECHGACCVEGDAGAPLEKNEVIEIEKVLPEIWDDLSPEAQSVIDKQGVSYNDKDGDLVTSIVNGKDCVFTTYNKNGDCICAIEKAYREGRITFYKPISCHLYPIRIKDYKTFSAINLHQWKICKAAEILGAQKGIKAYVFLKKPLIRKYGKQWYKELENVANEWLKHKIK